MKAKYSLMGLLCAFHPQRKGVILFVLLMNSCLNNRQALAAAFAPPGKTGSIIMPSEYLMMIILLILFIITGTGRYLKHKKNDPAKNTGTKLSEGEGSTSGYTAGDKLYDVDPQDLFLPELLYGTGKTTVREAYYWLKEVNESGRPTGWKSVYTRIYYVNLILQGIEKLEKQDLSSHDLRLLKGWALFSRARTFYDLVNIFGYPYSRASAGSDAGIPVKIDTDLQVRTRCATVKQTYQQILEDANQAAALLPYSIPDKGTKPTKASTLVFLSRVHFSMHNYTAGMTVLFRLLFRTQHRNIYL